MTGMFNKRSEYDEKMLQEIGKISQKSSEDDEGEDDLSIKN